MKRNVMLVVMIMLVAMMLFASGCAKARNQWASEGGFWGSVTGGAEGDYVIISQSGGEIMDVWKLRNVIVQSAEGSDGWLFRDSDGNAINLGGDVKVIRLKDKNPTQWEQMHEYHMEMEPLTYRETFNY